MRITLDNTIQHLSDSNLFVHHGGLATTARFLVDQAGHIHTWCVIFVQLGCDLKITCSKFQGNRFIIDREIDEKHALQINQNNCDSGFFW